MKKYFKRLVAVALVFVAIACVNIEKEVIKSVVGGEGGHSTYQSERPFEEIKSELSFFEKRRERIGEIEVFYGITPYSREFVNDSSGPINCQIAIKNGKTYIGFPIISGAF